MGEDIPKALGRKPKFTTDEVRSRMIETAAQDLLVYGVSSGVEAIRIDRVLVMAEIPRGSAYSTFRYGDDLAPQDNLRRETVLHILRTSTGNAGDPTREAALQRIDDLADDINSGDLARRKAARADVARVVAVFNQERLESASWRLYRALVTAATTTPDPDPEILAAIEEGEQRLVDTYVDLITDFSAVFGMTIKPDLTIEMFVLALIALNEGLTNHSTEVFSTGRQKITRDDQTDWTLYGICSEGLANTFFDMT